MQYDVSTVEEYIEAIPENRKDAIVRIREIVKSNLPDGFEEIFSCGMISYVVPLSKYPKGYHVTKGEPLPFLALASQKNHVALYHLGLYAEKSIEEWFADEYSKRVKTKLDMGKSCIRFKNVNHIPYDLIAELCQKISVEKFIEFYEFSLKRRDLM